MKFVVGVVSKVSGRLGRLSFQEVENDKSFQTPLLVQSTKAGSIPYLSREVFNYVTNEREEFLQICLANCDHMCKALDVHQKGIGSFIGYDEDTPTFLTLKDSCEIAPSGFHEKDIVPLFTRRGKATITVDRYMNFVEKAKPTIYQSLCDSDTNDQSAKKRIWKSVERTEYFFKKCIEKHKNSEILQKCLFFASIVGGYSKEARTKCINTVLQEPYVGGYFIDGLHNYGDTALNVKVDSVKDIVSHCLTTLHEDKPRMMQGAYTPLAVVELVQLGIDIFDSSYVYIAVTNFWALTFNFDILKPQKHIPIYIDLNEDKYRESFEPLVEDCSCYTCKKHTKAYLHHLIKVKELLCPILLMIHNSHHYLKFFDYIRKAISEDKMPDLIELIKRETEMMPKKVTNPKEKEIITENNLNCKDEKEDSN